MGLQGMVALFTGARSGIGHFDENFLFMEGSVAFARDIAAAVPAYSAGANSLKLEFASDGYVAQ